MADHQNIERVSGNLSRIWDMYSEAIEVVRIFIKKEKVFLSGHKDMYTHAKFFVSSKPKKYFEEHFS